MTVYEHTVPPGLWILALLAAVVAAGISAWRFLPRNAGNAVLALLHLAVLALLAWCLLLPGRKDSVAELRKPRFLIVLDVSRSMQLSPSQELPTRWQTARQALRLPWVQALAADCEVALHPLGATLAESVPLGALDGLLPDSPSTLLRDGLRQLAERYAGLDVAGVVLLSDGSDTREASDDWAADPRPFPIHTVRLEPPGQWQRVPDLRVDALTTARRATVGWRTEMKVKVSGQGTGGTAFPVQLFRNGELHAETPTQIPDEGGERVITFQLDHPSTGVFEFRAFVPPLEGETNTEDNEQTVSIEVVDARNRLLYVEGTPRWEYKYLRRVLLADPQVSAVVFHTGADGQPQGGGGDLSADMSPPELSLCKVVVVGDLDAAELGPSRAANLVRFVENGGSLVLAGGRKAWGEGGVLGSELARLLPVRGRALVPLAADEPFPVRLTDMARAHPAFAGDPGFWNVVPPVLSVFAGASLQPAAQALVVAETPDGPAPVIATQRYGDGKVAAVLTDSLWRWQLGPEAAEHRLYQRFWTQLVSWLLPQEEQLAGERIDLFADLDQVFFGESLHLHARLGDATRPGPAAVRCTITMPDGRRVPFQMHAGQVVTPAGASFAGFTLPFTPESAGAHKAVAEADVAGRTIASEPFSFFVQPFSPETLPRPINTMVLESLATSSGGWFCENLEQLDETLAGLEFHAIEDHTAEFHTLWRTWPIIIAVMTTLAATWCLRKLRNMP